MISIKNNKVRWGLSAVLAILILFGTYRNVFSLAAFLICGLMVAFCDRETILLQIFFIMPMANLFKMTPGTQSFFTILILVYVVLHLVLPRKATFWVILFAVYVLIGELLAGQFDLFRTIKLICNILFISCTLNSDDNLRQKEIFLSYIIGNIVASFFATLDSGFFKIESYIGAKALGTAFSNGEEITRFAGLYLDPNYYSTGMIISLCLLVVLFHKKDIRLFVLALFTVPIVYFLIQTYSKSAIIMLFVPLAYLIYSFSTKKNYLAVVVIIVLSVTAVILALSGKIPALDIVLSRIEASDIGSGDMDINTLTTGRFDLWKIYVEHLIKNIKTLIFGDGITADLLTGRATHNVYLEMLYHIGLVGTLLLFMSLKEILAQSIKMKFRRNIMNYCVMICIIVTYFFLSQLFCFDPPFQIFIGFLVLNMQFSKDIKKGSTACKLQ